MMNKEYLHELFKYDDGLIWTKVTKYNPHLLDTFAGNLHAASGYYRVRIDGMLYRLHRIVWVYHNGDIPSGKFVDHIDGDKSNNRIENLRLANYSQNQHNRKLCSTNTSGVKGVYWDKKKKKWRGRLEAMGKKIHVGYFDTLEEAEAAMTIARNKLHGEFARHK